MFYRVKGALKKGHREQRGITGLETAIILIAFVTVAAVFGYAVLSAGIFSAEKGKETVYLGLQEAKSTMELKGSIIATGNTTATPAHVSSIKFTVGNAVSGEPIDLTAPPSNKTVLAYIDENTYQNNMTWTCSFVGSNDGDSLLEIGEKAEITVDLSGLATKLQANKRFTIEFKPAAGSTVVFDRTVPANVDAVMDLY
jgi:flagellin FlaB